MTFRQPLHSNFIHGLSDRFSDRLALAQILEDIRGVLGDGLRVPRVRAVHGRDLRRLEGVSLAADVCKYKYRRGIIMDVE